MTEAEQAPPGVDPTVASPSRMYDYGLGGTANFEVDRIAVERIRANMPEVLDAAWANRAFHQRAARWMAREQGIGQFLDIGSGLPTQNNTHDAVRKETPDARVVYVDNDPMVAAHARFLLGDSRGTALITADLRDPDSILNHPDLTRLIDMGQPTGLLMTAVLHFVADGSDPWRLVRRYIQALAPGSYLAVSHVTADQVPPRPVRVLSEAYRNAAQQLHMRPKEQVERFFAGLELVTPYDGAEPAVGYVGDWGAEDPGFADSDGSRWFYCGVARRP